MATLKVNAVRSDGNCRRLKRFNWGTESRLWQARLWIGDWIRNPEAFSSRPADGNPMWRRIYALLRDSVNVFLAKNAASRGAAIAFCAVTSIAPVLLIVIAVAGTVFGEEAARGAIFAQFRGLLGPDGADLLQKTIASASGNSSGIMASIIGIVTLILAASGVFLELEEALNDIWEVKATDGLSRILRARLTSLGLVLALGFLLLVSLVIDAGLQALSDAINMRFPFGAALLMGLSFIVSLVLIAIMFAAIYKLLPAKPLSWRYVIFGAGVSALLFQIGKFLIGLYLGSRAAASSLGAAGALLGLLFWVYYSAQIFLFGAALTKTHFDHLRARRGLNPTVMP
jgi:membrane protein